MRNFLTLILIFSVSFSFAQKKKKSEKHSFTASILFGAMPYKVTSSNPNERIFINQSFFYGAGVKYSYNLNKRYIIDVGLNASINSFKLGVKSVANNSDYAEHIPIIPILGSVSIPLAIHRKIYTNEKLYITAGAGIAYNYYGAWGAAILAQDQPGKKEIMEWKLYNMSNIGAYNTHLVCAELHLGATIKLPFSVLSVNCFLSVPNTPINNSGSEYTVYDANSKVVLGKGTASNAGNKIGIQLGIGF